ncbi:unnamed protein product [Prorocentrum cordatum]|uniref:Uncharacterized protein n=1 Tax=Prorocentrum cordatum TaxID=2364126 RepID=A0ABN9WP67_9DINO|nr:unnamed protein product [Polarella glacialis]
MQQLQAQPVDIKDLLYIIRADVLGLGYEQGCGEAQKVVDEALNECKHPGLDVIVNEKFEDGGKEKTDKVVHEKIYGEDKLQNVEKDAVEDKIGKVVQISDGYGSKEKSIAESNTDAEDEQKDLDVIGNDRFDVVDDSIGKAGNDSDCYGSKQKNIVEPNIHGEDKQEDIEVTGSDSFEDGGNGIVGNTCEEWGTDKEQECGELLNLLRACARTARHDGTDPCELLAPMLKGLPIEQRSRAEAAIWPRRAREACPVSDLARRC